MVVVLSQLLAFHFFFPSSSLLLLVNLNLLISKTVFLPDTFLSLVLLFPWSVFVKPFNNSR
jgi:hypothetical protein